MNGTPPHPVDDRKRLAPAFVEWMMGFPPGWTEGMSRTQALKALGNAVVPQQAAYAALMLFEEAIFTDQTAEPWLASR